MAENDLEEADDDNDDDPLSANSSGSSDDEAKKDLERLAGGSGSEESCEWEDIGPDEAFYLNQIGEIYADSDASNSDIDTLRSLKDRDVAATIQTEAVAFMAYADRRQGEGRGRFGVRFRFKKVAEKERADLRLVSGGARCP